MQNTLDGGEAILAALRSAGIDYIICSPGSEWGPVWEAVARQKVEGIDGPGYIDCWHETLAVDMAAGYTLVTGRPQAVLLHAGVGLLQGSMGVHGAQHSEVPMLVMSGEALGYGEDPAFDPGSQWFRNLSIVGGPHRLIEPVVKWSSQVTSVHTIYESVTRGLEMAARAPAGPVYLNMPIETMLSAWTPPERPRAVPPAPRTRAPAEDVERLARRILAAKAPILITETVGRDVAAREALVELSELLALPVYEGRAANFANFPKDHAHHQGYELGEAREECDLALLVRCRAPWYPPSAKPPRATVVSIDERPLREFMVYQSLQADEYLEGDVEATLRGLADAARDIGVDEAAVSARAERLAADHEALRARNAAAVEKAREATPVDPVWLCHALAEALPKDTVYVNETTRHSGIIQQHLPWNGPQDYFYVQGGLGQGLGLALGVKLALRDRPVCLLIGDGSFLYNPVLQSLGASRDGKLPILVVVFNNHQYAAMKANHLSYYPEGVAATNQLFHGVAINGPDYGDIAGLFGGRGWRVSEPGPLADTLREAMAAVQAGTTAIVNVDLNR